MPAKPRKFDLPQPTPEQAEAHKPVIERLTRDLAKAAATLSVMEARYLVDYYYISQDDRKRAHHQERTLAEGEEPHLLLGWLAEQSRMLENQIKRVLDKYTDAQPLGQWAKDVVGIGPVIAAGLLAHIDFEPWRCMNKDAKKACKQDEPCTPECKVEQIHSVGHIWRFAGLDPTSKWNKGEKRPWNADLKVLCWKIGQSFMKNSGNDKCVYGKWYLRRKAYEQARNDSGGNAELAARILQEKNYGKGTDAYAHLTAGHLPPAQIDARARRWAVKLFLAHYHGEGHQLHFGKPAPLPYPIQHLGHVHQIHPGQAPDEFDVPKRKRA
jgi:hypothetical protein